MSGLLYPMRRWDHPDWILFLRYQVRGAATNGVVSFCALVGRAATARGRKGESLGAERVHERRRWRAREDGNGIT